MSSAGKPVVPLVHVVDDDEALRDSLRWLLESGGHAVACHASAESFLAAYAPDQPGCLLLDVRMPGMNGLELQAELRQRGHAIPVVMITGHGDVPTAVSALKKGALEFIEKPFDDRALLAVIANALALDAEARSAAAGRLSVAARLTTLTPREREVMDHIIAGKRNRDMAEAMDVSIKTIEAHRAKVMQKMAADSLAELVNLVQLARDPATPRRG